MIAALAVLLCPMLTMAQFTISGKVSEKSNNSILPGATIRLKGKAATSASDPNGKYEFKNLPAGNYTVVVSFLGYQTQEQSLNLQADAQLDFKLNQFAFLGNEIVVSSTRATANSASTYKNIDKKTIAKNNFGQDLPFLLDNTPGVVITSDAGAGVGYTGIRIRGSDATRVNVTLNGIPYNDSESQGTFWVNMPDFASSVDNIQIQRGVGSSTNGAGAFGGSLNIQTTTGETDPYAELNNTYGSFDTWKNTVKVGTGLIDGKFSFDGRLSRIKSDGFIDRAASDLKSYFLSGTYHGKSDLLKINVFSGTEKTYQAWNGIPESRLRGDVAGMNDYIARNGLSAADATHLLNSNSRTYNSFTYNDQTDNYWQTHYQALYAKQFSEKFSFNGALHYTDGRGYFEEFKADDRLSKYGLPNITVDGQVKNRTDLVRRRWLDNDFYGFTYNFDYKVQQNLRFTLGGAYNEYKGKHFGELIWARFAPSSNIYDHYFDGEGNKNDFNVFGKIAFNPTNDLNLFVDLQYRKVDYTISGLNKNREPLNFDNTYNFFNPKIGATWLLNSQSNLYASYSVANKEPNRDDFTNLKPGLPNPKAERLNNIEIGYRYKNDSFNIGANAYGMFYKDQLIFTGEINEYSDAYRQNVDKSSRIGIELDAAYNISSKFAINANAALSRNKIKNYVDNIANSDVDYNPAGYIVTTYSNPDISFSPRAIIGGELVYTPIKSFAIALQSKYVGKQFMDNTQNEARKLAAYWVNNFRLGYDLKLHGIKNANIGLLVNNVFDKKYESNGYTYSYGYDGAITTENFYFAQAGTNFMLSLNLKF
jgi:iron complex outermembrane receptor protein